MQFFTPSWSVLEQKKILYGLVAIVYAVWRIQVGDTQAFLWLVKIFGGFVFVAILSSSITSVFGMERMKKYSDYLTLASAVLYIYFLEKL